MASDSNRHQSHEEEAEVNSIKIIKNDDNEIMINMDGEDLIFSSLPNFPCLSSPTSASSATNHPHHLVGPNGGDGGYSNYMSTSSTSSNSTSSTSSSSWAPAAPLLHMQQPLPCQQQPPQQQEEEDDTDDIFGDIAAELLDPSFLFPTNDLFPLMHQEEQEIQDKNDNNNNNSNSIGFNNSSNDDIQQVARESGDRELSDDLAAIFLEWLKSNRDTISPEDLRSIKLKKSTIDCAAARLGGTKQGRTQLLKLILTWVQDHHLRKKQGGAPQPPAPPSPPPPPPTSQEVDLDQCYYYFPNYPQYPPPNPNPSPMMNLDYMNCEPSWMPPPLPQPPPPPYNNYYQPRGGGPGIVMNGQPFSPPADFHTQVPVMNYPPFVGAAPLPQYVVYPNGGGGASCCAPVGPGAAASATREARKKRMARQRRLSSLHQHKSSTGTQSASVANVPMRQTEGSGSNSKRLSFWSSRQKNHRNVNTPVMMPTPASTPSNMQQQQLQLQDVGSNPSDKRVLQRSDKNLKFLLQKVLKQSDVGSLGRIVLPKKEAEIHLPELDSRDGISIPMEDIGTSRVWTMRYRFWPNNKSRMYLLENTGDFVRANELQEGDFIVIYSDVKCNKFMIRGVKVKQALERKETNVGKAHQRKKKNKCSNSKAIAASSSVENFNYSISELNPYSDEDGDDSALRTMVDVI